MAKSENHKADGPAGLQAFSEEEFKAKLREIGRLQEPAGKVPTPKGEFTPVVLKGKPLSESVVEERR